MSNLCPACGRYESSHKDSECIDYYRRQLDEEKQRTVDLALSVAANQKLREEYKAKLDAKTAELAKVLERAALADLINDLDAD